ncbi:MAG: PEGA domain-containing protein [Deltaproteobacteria bacterium]|nr:PEGA domain-containing protein [Deltaproteobacteria bacterium]
MIAICFLVPGAAAAQPVEKAAEPAPPPVVRIAFWRLKSMGVDDATAGRLEIMLRAEAGQVRGFALQARERTDALLAGKAQLLRCGGESRCLCEIGRALEVDKLVTGVIGALGDDYTFDLKMIDVASCREERRINEALSGREDLLIGAIRKALYKLVAPEQYVGSLSVELPMEGAAVKLDGADVGVTPLPGPIAGLTPGVHKLQIAKQGFSSFQEDVSVRFAQMTRVKVDLVKSVLVGLSYEEEQEPGEQPQALPGTRSAVPERETSTMRILAWTFGGLALASAAAAGILGWRAMVAEDELERAANAAQPYLHSGYQDTYDRGKLCATLSNVGWALAGASAAASVVLFVLDLTGDDSEDGSVQVVPDASEKGGGVTLRFRF